MASLPEFFRVRQRFASQAIDNVEAAVAKALAGSALDRRVRPGQSVGIAVGSRGIANLACIVSEVVKFISSIGGDPCIIPAMGSHGGATPEGQTKVLAGLGVTAESMGCPIDASMETISVGVTERHGVNVHFSRAASRLDHIVVINRVKPHTRLAGRYESGLCKMLMIGLGKNSGASSYHKIFPRFNYSLNELAPEIVTMIVDKMPVTLGLAIVEDAFEQTSLVEAVASEDFLLREPELLKMARARMPKLPFDSADLLIVDRIGKEISGSGMDTNVIGRKVHCKQAAPDEYPKIRQIHVRSLTEKAQGNGYGLGMADYCHRRVVETLNKETTRVNCITSGNPGMGAIPLTFACDRDALKAVVSQAADDEKDHLRWMWISDTLHIDHVACSHELLADAQGRDGLEIMSEPRPLVFDQHGDLVSADD